MEKQQLASARFLALSDWHLLVYSLLLSGILTMGGCIDYLRDLANSVAFFGLHSIYLAVVMYATMSVRDTLRNRQLTKPSLAAALTCFIAGILACCSAIGFVSLSVYRALGHSTWDDTKVLPVIVYIALGIKLVIFSFVYCIVVVSFNNDALLSRYTKKDT